jgi:hypothetical protein
VKAKAPVTRWKTFVRSKTFSHEVEFLEGNDPDEDGDEDGSGGGGGGSEPGDDKDATEGGDEALAAQGKV